MTTRMIRNEEIKHSIIHRAAFTSRGIAISIAAALALVGCVAEIGDGTEDGAYLDESDVDSTQHMLYSGQRIQLRAAHSLKCADIDGAGGAGARLIQWDCTGSANQRFYIYQQPDGYWKLVAEHSGLCLDVPHASWKDGEAIQQYACHDGDNQRFSIEYSSGSYFIRPKYNGKCLEVAGYSLSNGGSIVQWPCAWSLNERFYIENT